MAAGLSFSRTPTPRLQTTPRLPAAGGSGVSVTQPGPYQLPTGNVPTRITTGASGVGTVQANPTPAFTPWSPDYGQAMQQEQLQAAQRANAVAGMLQHNSDNPQSVTGTTHTISSGGVGAASAGLRRAASGTTSGAGGDGGDGALTIGELTNLLNSLRTNEPREPSPASPATISGPAAPTVNMSAAYGKAKDATSRIANAALRGLRDNMTARGLSGSGIEAQNEADILSSVAGTQSQALFDAAAADNERQWDAAKTGYQGAITQRANDMGLSTSGYQGQVAQRGQNMDYSQQLLQNLRGFLPFLRY